MNPTSPDGRIILTWMSPIDLDLYMGSTSGKEYDLSGKENQVSFSHTTKVFLSST